jgi:alpha-L-fucosidase 2
MARPGGYHSAMSKQYHWEFPLPRTHTGILQGNGTFGAMIWGEGSILRITLGRADLWDHRGGKPWIADMNFRNIRQLLEAGDEAGLRGIFEQGQVPAGQPRRPSVLPIGRFDLHFADELSLATGTLDLSTGQVRITLKDGSGQEHPVAIDLDMHHPLLHVELPASLRPPRVVPVPAWEHVGEHLRSISFDPPTPIESRDLLGWTQPRPADPPLRVTCRQVDRHLFITADYPPARATTSHSLEAAPAAEISWSRADIDRLRQSNREWWAGYWQRVPQVEIPNENLTFLYHYGMYKFAGLTQPAGVAATLQGPWIEEYQMPPWSSDYHFNINVQMCYWPAFSSGLLDHLRPLFDMVWSWRDKLREHARLFIGIDDGLMLPHAVDDRCTNMGGFWTGTIDHGCTAWVGKMMHDYCRYTGDRQFLSDVALPFMRGAMRVYQAMLEKEGRKYRLPVSVSPEYRGNALSAWGANASFQLACIHWLAEALQEACATTGEAPDPAWDDIRQNLPRVAVYERGGRSEIALWEGTPLEESHRHHSYLAGICPFDMIDLDDPQWRPVVGQTLATWVREGMGLWSGWCVPWAAMLHTRAGNADAAELLLEIWQRVFTNEGHGTLHDVNFPGFSLMGAAGLPAPRKRGEIMQIEAGMAAAAAIMDMLLHTRRGVVYLFQGAPARWKSAGFRNLHAPGGFVVSAIRRNGDVQQVEITATRRGRLRLANPWRGRQPRILDVDLQEGETRCLRPDSR